MRGNGGAAGVGARAVLVAAVGAGLVVSACSRESGESSPGATRTQMASRAVDACALITAAEIGEVLGQPPGDPKAEMLGGAIPTCAWPAADGSDPQVVHLMIGLQAYRSYEDYLAAARQGLGEAFSGEDYRKVEGLGEFGVWSGDPRAGVLQVYTGTQMVQVYAVSGGGRDAQENAISLARRAMARLR